MIFANFDCFATIYFDENSFSKFPYSIAVQDLRKLFLVNDKRISK